MTDAHLLSEQRFAIGEVVILVYSRYHSHLHGPGDEVEVVEGFQLRYDQDAGINRFCYRIRYRSGETYFATPDQLRKKHPPAREDRQLTTWEKCVWQPKQVRA